MALTVLSGRHCRRASRAMDGQYDRVKCGRLKEEGPAIAGPSVAITRLRLEAEPCSELAGEGVRNDVAARVHETLCCQLGGARRVGGDVAEVVAAIVRPGS